MTITEMREYHDDTRTVVIYVGSESTQRPYTDEENAQADARLALKTNESQLSTDALSEINTLLASVETLKAITDKANSDIGPSDTKSVARETRRVARQLVRLTRIMLDAVETADTGIE